MYNKKIRSKKLKIIKKINKLYFKTLKSFLVIQIKQSKNLLKMFNRKI